MTILDDIVEHKYIEIKTIENIVEPNICDTDFTKLFSSSLILIAELKAASPSQGVITENFNPIEQAQHYIDGGANAISILTDNKFFNGSFDILKQIRAMSNLPLLCKDFILDKKQVRFARYCGADIVLLIVKILDDDSLPLLKKEIEKWGMKALIEIQTEQELDRALKVEPELLLINNRNLSSFEVNMSTTENLLSLITDDICVISASGIKAPKDLKNFPSRVDGYLIGTSLMLSENPQTFLRKCREN